MIPLGFCSGALILTGGGGTPPFVTTIGLAATATIGGGTFVSVANELFDAYNDAFMSATSNELTLERCDVTFPAGTGVVSVSSNRDPVAGGSTAVQAPLNVALLINKRTSTPGRNGKGRMFLPGILDARDPHLNGIISPAGVAAYQTKVDSFYNALQTTTGSLIDGAYVLHTSGPFEAPSKITSLSVSPKVGTMRRRLR